MLRLATLVALCLFVVEAFKYRHRYFVLPPPVIPMGSNLDPIQTYWYTQKLDHFDKSEKRTWQQRYMMNDIYYKPGGPVFYLFSGESELSSSFIQTVHNTTLTDMMFNARRHNAMAVTMEHRYYGQSETIEEPEKVENMKWLQARQALADVADFIVYFNKHHINDTNARWITFGGSYSGALTAWMRQEYPDLVLGSISSSGGMEQILDFGGYIGTVSNDLKIIRQSCWDATNHAFNLVLEKMKTFEGRVELKKTLGLCHDIRPHDPDSISATIDTLISPFMFTCQYGGDNRGPSAWQTVANLCNIVENINQTVSRSDPIARLGYLCRWQTMEHEHWQCLDNNDDEQINAARELNINRGWEWQLCNELGGFQTTTAEGTPFGGNLMPFSYRYQVCEQVFNMTVDQTIAKLEEARRWNGGNRGYNATNVVLLNGSQDPFHTMGVYKEEWAKPGQKVVLMKNKAHCADMYIHTNDDHPEVHRARKIIQESLDEWLSDQ